MPKTGELVYFEVESRLHVDYLEKVTKDVGECIKRVHDQLDAIVLKKQTK